MSETEVLGRLRPLVAEVLSVAPEKIGPESVLMADLGAESIDLLDLSFRIEEVFHVTIESNEVEREASKRVPGVLYETDGQLTAEALAEIRQSLPELDGSKLVRGLRKSDLPSLLNVQFFVKLIVRKLNEKERMAHA